MLNTKCLFLALLGATAFSGLASAQCQDPWVSQAVREVMNRPAQGSGVSGECYIGNYGGGRWSSYPDLKSKVAAHFQGVCRDAWVSQAVREVTGRNPNGYGDTGECAPAMYTGSWNSYPDLKNKVTARLRPVQPVYTPMTPPVSVIGQGGPSLAGRPQAGIVAAGAGNIVAAGAGNIVAAGAGNVIAHPQANIVAAGAGNIVAAGAGNFIRRGQDDLKLANQGDAQAQFHVGMAYANGEGVEKNLVEAYKWLSLASDGGVKEAADERKAVREKLDADQLKQANQAVKNFKPVAAEAK